MKFIIRADHKSSEHISTQKHLSRQMVRWIEYLQKFDYHVEYKPGKENVVADALSRLYSIQVAAVQQEECLDWPLSIPNYLQHRKFSNDVPITIQELIKNELGLFVYDESNEILLQKLNDKEKAPYVPFVSRLDLVIKMHNAYGHIGAEGIQELLRTRHRWCRSATTW